MEEDKKSQAISVRQFVTARTQELAALSTRVQTAGPSTSGNQGTSKTTNNNNIPYQHIPKHLRRRAVSHNVKRIPSRFRPKIPTSVPTVGGGKKNSTSTTTTAETNFQGPLSFVSSKKKKKQFSRKHRRRKSNLLSEYNRRQRIHKWMETHIWHAKRFHMGLKWNCKIPLAPCEKGQRALYRSAKQYVTMQDVSFLSCLELQGDYETICEGFKSIAPKQCNTLSLAALMYRNGEREGKLQVYHKNSYPFGYIGEIQFMWVKSSSLSSSDILKEKNDKDKDPTTLWIWVHPGFKNEFILELTSLFNLEQVMHKEQEDGEKNSDSTKEKLAIDEIKLIPKKLHCKPTWTTTTSSTVTATNNNNNKIILTDLFGELNRLRFYGPEILSVFKEVLHMSLPEISSTTATTTSSLVETPSDELSSSNIENIKWIDKFFSEQSTKKRHDYLLAQKLLWKVIEDVQDFPCQTILPLIVRDPRIFLPQSRTKVLRDFYQDDNIEDEGETITVQETDIETKEKEEIMEVDTASEHSIVKSKQVVKKDDNEINILNVLNKFLAIAQNPLSNPEYRIKLVKEKMTDAEYCQKRSQLLIPGSQIDLGIDENQVPIILIQRPSTSNSKSFSDGGFDLILPSGWAMAFWIAFVYRAVRVSGLRDSKTFAFEAGALHSPPFFGPDSQTGFQDESETGKEVRETFFNLPPAKRANLIKLNCTCPFSPDWNTLLYFWKLRNQSFKKDEKGEQSSLSSSSPMEISEEEETTTTIKTASEMSKFYILRDIELLKMIKKLYKSRKWSELNNFLNNLTLHDSNSIRDPESCLLGVKLQSWNRGKAIRGAVICLPAQSDLDNLKRKKVINVEPESLSSSTIIYADPGKRNVSDPPIHIEPSHDDKETNQRRTELRQKHQKIMAYLRKKRKKFRDKSTQAQLEFQQSKAIRLPQQKSVNGSAINTTSSSSGTIDNRGNNNNIDKLLSDIELYKDSAAHFDSTTISKLYNETVNDLWLVSGEKDKGKEKILQSFRKNSRVPAGFVVYGSDEYSRGKCAALGYITLSSLVELSRLFAEEEIATTTTKLAEQKVQESSTIQKSTAPFLLVRNWMDSAIYRQVKCDILLV